MTRHPSPFLRSLSIPALWWLWLSILLACTSACDDRRASLPKDFDAKLYLTLNPDVAKAGHDPADHYLDYGMNEGRPYRRPSEQALPPDFDPKLYLELNKDVAQSGIDPRQHYLAFAKREGRKYRPTGTLPPDFDAKVYLALNPDVAEAGIDPALHYLTFGREEGRAYRAAGVAGGADAAAGPNAADANRPPAKRNLEAGRKQRAVRTPAP